MLLSLPLRTLRISSLLFTSCIMMVHCVKAPDASPYTLPCTYTFTGGSDMTSLFDLTATYINAEGQSVTEPITALPWKKAFNVSPPFNANLEVAFTRKAQIPDKDSYIIGFAGNITSTTSSPSSESSTAAQTSSDPSTAPTLLRFSIPLPQGVSADAINLRIAPLKFDKHFVFSFTCDDAVEGAYARLWRRIHQKWIDDTEFFHLGLPRTTGYLPSEPLTMGDGCGGERRFGLSVALWPTYRNSYSNYIPRIQESSTNSIYLTWKEVELLMDFDCSVCLHNCDETRYDKTDATQITQGLMDDYNKVLARIGRRTKIFALPDGNEHYLEAVRKMPQIEFSRSSLSRELIYPKTCGTLLKKETYGGGTSQTISLKLAELAQQSEQTNPYWVGFTSHRVDLDLIEMLETIYRLYGKAGKDNLWVASWEEVYEYITLREEASIHKEVSNGLLTFEVSLPNPNNFYFHELSFLLSGLASQQIEITPQSSNIVGMNYAAHGSEKLINVNFDPTLLSRVEKYTALYENSSQQEDKENALYLINRLLPSLRTPFLNRMENKETHPISILTFTINGGAAKAYNSLLSLQLTHSGEATAWRVSEKADFSDAEWQTYTTGQPLTYNCTSKGTKKLYLQMKNAWNTSNTLSASITVTTLPSSGTIDKEALETYLETYNGYKASYTRRITAQ